MNKIASHLRSIIITLGIASGMSAAVLAYIHTPDNCRAMILRDAGKHRQFMDNVAAFTGQQDYLTAMTRGGK